MTCVLVLLAGAASSCAPSADAPASGGATGGQHSGGATQGSGGSGGSGGPIATGGTASGSGGNSVVDASASGGDNGGGPDGPALDAGPVGSGGASSDASLDTAGPRTDGAADQGPTSSALCPPNALVCEDFEDGNLDGWTRVVNSGTLAIDSVHASSGKNALGINIPANQRGGFIQRTGAPLFPLPNKAMYGRAMVYFDSVSDGHTDFVRGATASAGTPWYNVGEQHGEIMLNYYNGSAFDCWARPSPGKPVPLKAWMCWEWSFDGNTNEMQFYINGALSRRVSATGDGCLSGQKSVWTAPVFGALQIGQYIAETRATVAQMWIDDIAVGNTGRIGCPAPP